MKHLLVAVFVFVAPLQGAQAQRRAELPPGLDAYVERLMRTFEVPGLALAIVKDGRVLLAKGYGVRTVGRTEPVDAQTRFGIASNSKAFTAVALGMLVEEGKLEWDRPVVEYLPWFQLADPYITRQLTVRDLLVHQSGLGLGAGDLLWWPPTTYTRKEIVRRLRELPIAHPLRYRYAYNNNLYIVAGELIEAVSGQTWEEFVGRRILDRLGMRNSDPRLSAAAQPGNVATPHAPVEGRLRPVRPYTHDAANPAGGINSCAEDMARWMIALLDSGRLADGSRLFSPRLAHALWTIVTPMPIPERMEAELEPLRMQFNGYGLGFQVRDYRGRKLATHTGGLPGYLSRVALVPELKLGVAVLTNQESGAAFNALTWWVLDYYLGVRPAYDWIEAYRRLQERTQRELAQTEARILAQRDSTRGPSLPLERYAGRYRDAWYGDVEITYAEGRLRIRFLPTESLQGELRHWQYDTFWVRWDDRELRADAFLTFWLSPDGSIAEARLRPVSPATDFSFDFQDLRLVPVPHSR
ncbi:MAG: serine hydrolase [Bacteroidetes bacterium]|nr:serine hydrolase [Rhodothermia bacterium]MCX7907094.1 serine hydrolase [Bacteroidota bacterium]MDW8285504.1 serine hydrolase [Bacteroidota bacterium]